MCIDLIVWCIAVWLLSSCTGCLDDWLVDSVGDYVCLFMFEFDFVFYSLVTLCVCLGGMSVGLPSLVSLVGWCW